MQPLDVLLKYPAPILAWVLPLLGALLTPLFAKISERIRDLAALLFSFSAVVCSALMIPWLISEKYPGDVQIAELMKLPTGGVLEVGVLVDPLSIVVANVVAFISFLIVVYSIGYMQGDPGLTRYWFFFQFFIGSMLLLVLSDNLIQMLVGWEGVGICSYGLIGFYYRDPKERWLGGPPPTKMFPPSHCGMKAFVVTGIGDVFLLASIFMVYNYAGTFNFVALIHHSESWLHHMAAVPGLLSVVSIFFLGGPIGKSAQFPLHEWLPEAMAGPTSVSALIHAATMVKAGVYLVARISPVFYIGRWALNPPIVEAGTFFIVIAVVGAFTAFLAASQAVVSLELKKILAYSTVSQIGYMMLGLGVSGLSEGGFVLGMTSGIFHLVSHALFKAALFLCAGSVIHAIESIYITDMGGLRRWMPITHGFMLLATLSLSGLPPFSGFWSKDAVLVAALSTGSSLSLALLAVAAASAALTFFYSLRMLSLVFYGRPSHHIEEMEQHGHHVHEAKPIMWIPYGILVVLMVAVSALGVVGFFVPAFSPERFIETRFEYMIEHMFEELHLHLHVGHVETVTTLGAMGLSAAMLVIGGVAGGLLYLRGGVDRRTLIEKSSMLRSLHSFLWNRWYLNSLYYKVFVDGTLRLKDFLFWNLESRVIDRISAVIGKQSLRLSDAAYSSLEVNAIERGVNRGVPKAAEGLYNQVKKIQTGVLSYNVLYIVLVLFVFLVIFMLGVV